MTTCKDFEGFGEREMIARTFAALSSSPRKVSPSDEHFGRGSASMRFDVCF
ncbi:MAG: hypothetical protein QOH16_3523 [Gaiellaceae bacterium]|nr:hypothetical protein [Gaiellaceae bacterium]